MTHPSDIRDDTNGTQPAPPEWFRNWCDLNGFIMCSWSPKGLYWTAIQRGGTGREVICYDTWSIEQFLGSLPHRVLNEGWDLT